MASTMQQFATSNILDCMFNRGNKCGSHDDMTIDLSRSWYQEEYPAGGGKRVDLFVNVVYMNGNHEIEETYAFEVKSCHADLYSGCGMNFIGKRNFIIVPEFGWSRSFVEAHHRLEKMGRHDVGILTIDKMGTISCWRSSWLHEKDKLSSVIGSFMTSGFGDVYEGIIV